MEFDMLPLLDLFTVVVAQAPNGDVTPTWAYILIGLGMTFGGAAIALLGKLLGKLTDYLATKTGLHFLAEVDEVLMGVVNTVYQDQVEPWKRASADGKLTKVERENAKEIAIASLKKSFSLDALEGLFDAAGEDLHQALGHRVERAVSAAKNSGKAARAGDQVGPTDE
jgi:hypothetical protein